jgi:hypothetical protein
MDIIDAPIERTISYARTSRPNGEAVAAVAAGIAVSDGARQRDQREEDHRRRQDDAKLVWMHVEAARWKAVCVRFGQIACNGASPI